MGITNFTGGGNSTPPPPPGANGSGIPMLPPPSMDESEITEILIDLNDKFASAAPALFRDKVVEQTLAVLIRSGKPNPLLIGPAGVGKTRIVEEIARLIATKDPRVPATLADKTVYELPMSALVAGAGIVGQLEARVQEIVEFATDPANKAVLFIDEIHVLGDTRDPVYSKVAQILKPALARGDMHLIGATTHQEARNLEDDPAFQRRFTRLIVDELTREQTIEVLKSIRPSLLAHHNYKVAVSDETLALVATMADEYSRANQHRPDNAVTLLDQALADLVVSHGSAIATAQARGDAATVTALQSISQLTLSENKLRSVAMRLASGVAEKAAFDADALRSSLSSLRGQDEVVDELVDALEREELGAFPRTRPLAWLLAGPSGTGKTETAKRVAHHLTGQEPIQLNMGEYAHEHDLSKLIGSGPGYIGSDSNKELPFDTLESNPYRVILLDELEKAHRVVHRLLLTALDEGWMRMASGKVVDFSKATIIATTNAGREALSKSPVGFSTDNGPSRADARALNSALREHFDPEFLGRFQKIVAYAPLTRELYGQILSDAYEAERDRLLVEKPYLGAKVPALDDATLAAAVAQTYVPDQGARPAQRAARRLVEDAILTAQRAAAAAFAGGGASSADADTEGNR